MSRLHALVLIGGQYHPFAECGEILRRFIHEDGRFEPTVSEDWNQLCAGAIARYDLVVAYTQGGEPGPGQLSGLLDHVKDGGAFVGLHGASATWKACAEYHHMLGCSFAGHGPVAPFTVEIVCGDSPITQGLSDFPVEDELYRIDGLDRSQCVVLATAIMDGREHVVAYTRAYGAGRVFYLSLGHDQRAFSLPQFQRITLQGMAWAAAMPTPPPAPREVSR